MINILVYRKSERALDLLSQYKKCVRPLGAQVLTISEKSLIKTKNQICEAPSLQNGN